VSNQALLWGTLIVPWLSLIFMPKEEVKRYIAAGLLATLLSIIVTETGIRHGWWAILETTYPFAVIPTYTYGFFPVMPMWLLKYTYGRFGLFFAVDTVFNIIFAFLVLPWFDSRRIIDFDGSFQVFIFESLIAIIMYSFQLWQEGIFLRKTS